MYCNANRVGPSHSHRHRKFGSLAMRFMRYVSRETDGQSIEYFALLMKVK